MFVFLALLAPGPSLSERVAYVMAALRSVIAAHAGRDRSAEAVAALLWPYLHRLGARFAALAARIQAGKVLMAPARRQRAAPLTQRLRPPSLPQGFAWLIRLAPGTTALGSQLRHLLANPEFAALLAQAPQAGRILRPLCRMLGIAAGPEFPQALFAPLAPRPSPTQASSMPEPLAAPSPAPAPAPAPAPEPPTPSRPLHRRYARPRVPVSGTALA